MLPGLHEMVFGETGQTLWHVPPVPVSAATYVLEDLLTHEVIEEGGADVDPFEATATATAGPGTADHRRISVDFGEDPEPIEVGRAYAIVAADRRCELLVCAGHGADYIVASTPLSGVYPAGSTVEGVRISAPFPDETAEDERLVLQDHPLGVTWRYEIGERTVPVLEQVRLVRAPFERQYLGAVETSLRLNWAELVQALPPHGNTLRELVQWAGRKVATRLRAKGIHPNRLMMGAQGHELVEARAVLHMADLGHCPANRDPSEFREDMRKDWLRCLDDLTNGSPGQDTVDINARGRATAPQSQRRRRGCRRA